MNGDQASDGTVVEIEVAIAGGPALEEPPALAPVLFPATVGPCPACRRIVSSALGDRPGFPLWFHLGPRAGLCLRHREGVKASE